MASGFFALLDDIATLMDDVATMGKVAGKNTAGILGDDLAVNAEKSSGFLSSRELPALWAIAKGSLINKVIILPLAFLLSAFVPVAIVVILILGGLYLAYEGAEKVYEFLVPHRHDNNHPTARNLSEDEILAIEKQKVKSAVITDFILSVEIVIIALGSVMEEPLLMQILVVSIIALLATVGVYGLVALIVRMDDLGFRLIRLNPEDNTFSDKVGRLLVRALPIVIKSLSVIGTIALFLVSGGLFVHNLPFIHHLEASIHMPALLFEFLAGLLIGFVVLLIIFGGTRLWKKYINESTPLKSKPMNESMEQLLENLKTLKSLVVATGSNTKVDEKAKSAEQSINSLIETTRKDHLTEQAFKPAQKAISELAAIILTEKAKNPLLSDELVTLAGKCETDAKAVIALLKN